MCKICFDFDVCAAHPTNPPSNLTTHRLRNQGDQWKKKPNRHTSPELFLQESRYYRRSCNYLFVTSLVCLETVSSELDFVCIGKVGSILTAPAFLLLLETAISEGTQTGAHDVCQSHRLLSQGTRYTQRFLEIWLLDITTIVEESLAGSPSGVFLIF